MLFQLKVQCHSKKSVPRGISRGSATIDHQFAYFTPLHTPSVYQYEWCTDQWKELPSCPYAYCALAIIDGKLTTLGGWYFRSDCTNKLFTLRQSKWVEEYPPMKTECTSPAVVSASDGDYLIAIGGDFGGACLWTPLVQLFQVKTRRWYETVQLPRPLPLPSATICGDQVHVISGEYEDYGGYSCSLQALPPGDQPITQQSLSHLLSWNPLPCLPQKYSTAATLCGQLVIIGGVKDRSLVKSIHQLVEGQWVEIGCMNSGRYDCFSVSPSPDKLIIVGGSGSPNSVEECIIAQQS